MVLYVRTYEQRKWGRNHLVTISFAEPEPKGLNATTAFRRSDLDFATMHLYLGASKAPKPGDAPQAGIDFASGVTYARRQVKDNRPVMDGESGPIDKWIPEAALDDEVFHEMSWRHLMAGGAGAGTRWPYRNPHHITIGMLEVLRGMRQFCDGVSWASMTGSPVSASVSGATEWSVFGTTDGAIAWLRLAPTEREFSVAWAGLANNHVRIRTFDIARHRWIDLPHTTDGKSIRFTAPEGRRELATWISR